MPSRDLADFLSTVGTVAALVSAGSKPSHLMATLWLRPNKPAACARMVQWHWVDAQSGEQTLARLEVPESIEAQAVHLVLPISPSSPVPPALQWNKCPTTGTNRARKQHCISYLALQPEQTWSR
jgi:hypothetical protein